ncbi:MAG TPA: hypothetical protein VJ911_00325 [Cryomorphaceae bacterium]|nr:hypothetical protein [Cryomorphaceae bacterium]
MRLRFLTVVVYFFEVYVGYFFVSRIFAGVKLFCDIFEDAGEPLFRIDVVYFASSQKLYNIALHYALILEG